MFGRGKVIDMKKFLTMAALILGLVAVQLVAMPQVSAQEIYLGEDSYLLTETVSYKPVGGKMMYCIWIKK